LLRPQRRIDFGGLIVGDQPTGQSAIDPLDGRIDVATNTPVAKKALGGLVTAYRVGYGASGIETFDSPSEVSSWRAFFMEDRWSLASVGWLVWVSESRKIPFAINGAVMRW
jgi:hypothetical protein